MAKLLLTVFAIVIGSLLAITQPTRAATMTCSSNSITFSLGDASAAVCSSGDTSHNSPLINPFGMGMTYTLGDLTGSSDGDGTVQFTTEPSTGQTNWAVSNFVGQIVIELKQASAFALFLIDSGVLTGTWGTVGPGMSTNDVSHAAVWHKPTVVPLPAALPLFAGGIFLLGLLGWRRKRVATA